MGRERSFEDGSLCTAGTAEDFIMKLENMGKNTWIVMLIVFSLGFLSVLATTAFKAFLSNGVDSEGAVDRVEGLEGYPSWEELVKQMRQTEKRNSKRVTVKVIGRYAPLYSTN